MLSEEIELFYKLRIVNTVLKKKTNLTSSRMMFMSYKMHRAPALLSFIIEDLTLFKSSSLIILAYKITQSSV